MEVFRVFLRLGSTSFGGPIAHLGYFHAEFVARRRWLDDAVFAQLVAFCSVLPGPTSSQVGLLVGYRRAGLAGAIAAWLGFTTPSALALTALGLAVAAAEAHAAGRPSRALSGALAGLAAAATAVVAQAVLTMARSGCPERTTRLIALAAAALAFALRPVPGLQWLPIVLGALGGALALRDAADGGEPTAPPIDVGGRAALAAGTAFALIVTVAGPLGERLGAGPLLGTIVIAGSLVFGGGHVVLPLLYRLVPAHLIAPAVFAAGYGAAQAMPGPLFAVAAFVGAANVSPLRGIGGAALATALIFLPPLLLLFAAAPVFAALMRRPAAPAALRGANAAVVGVLGALLVSPLLTDAAATPARLAIAAGAFGLVGVLRVAPWIAVLAAAAAGSALGA